MSRLAPRRLAAAVLSVTAVLSAAAPAQGADGSCTYIAARSGDDAAAGTDAAPFKTAQRLVDALEPGQTGCLRAGTYPETPSGFAAYVTKPGTTLRSYPGERAHVLGTVTVMREAAGTRIAGLAIEGTGEQNVVKVYAPDVVLEDNEVTTSHRTMSCLMLGSPSAGRAVRVTVRRNVLRACGSPEHGNKDHAIYAADVQDGDISDNLIVDPAAYAIQLYPNAHGTRFAHNVVDGGASVRGGVVFGSSAENASSGNVVEANVIAFAAGYGIAASWEGEVGSGNVARDNCIFQAGWGAVSRPEGFSSTRNIEADPQFVDRAAGDLRLRAGSRCLEVVGYDTAARLGGEPAGSAAVEAVPVAPVPEPAPAAPAAGDAAGTVSAPVAPGVRSWTEALRLWYKRDRRLRMAARTSMSEEVREVRFYVGGKLRARDRTAPYRRTWRVPARLRARRLKLTASAYDEAGRIASSSVTMRGRR